ncbi:MAG TPA: divalent metal cation transporter [Gemmatimonadales bacterium]|nr:divalent metal cation transporter [Gemmatimonadales bacterium]
MKRILEIALGIITGIGGFLEAGSLATAVQAGADFRFELIWAIVLGAACLAFLVEMSGRLAAISKHTVADAVRERFGFRFYLIAIIIMQLVMLLVLAAELGGVAIALQLVSGVSYRWWTIPVALVAWVLLWRGTFGLIEKGVSVLGLVTLAFVVGALQLHPPLDDVARGALPHLPSGDAAHYWFLAVSILGASISPYLFAFYAAGAVEDRWDVSHLNINRVTAGFGMGFGGIVAIGALVTAGIVFHPAGIEVKSYEQLPVLLTTALGDWGFPLFVASLGIACFGAAQEIALTSGYMLAQGLGWQWSENLQPAEDARFSLSYTVMIALATIPALAGVDILKLTNISMVFSAASLPIVVGPMLIIMNDKRYLREYGNGWFSNTMVALIIALAFVLAIVSVPLLLKGG